MEQLANLYSTTLAAPYVAGSLAITVTSATGAPTTGTFSLTILDASTGDVILIFRVTSVASTVFTGAAEGPDSNAASASVVVGTILSAAAITQLFADHGGGGGFIQALTAPVSGDFTQNNFNVGSSVVSTQTNISTPVAAISIMQHDPAGTAEMAVLLTPVTPPYTLIAAISGIATLANDWFGLVVSDGTQLRTLDLRNSTPEGLGFTTFSGSGTSTLWAIGPFTGNGPLVWMKIQETVSARIYSLSSDGGVTWAQAFTESNTAGLTTSQIGFTCQKRNGSSSGPDCMVTLYSWAVTNP